MVSLDNQLMAAPIHVTPARAFESGKAEPLFRVIANVLGTGHGLYDVSPDGQRILTVAPQREEKSETLNVVQNWTAALKK